MTRDPAVDAIVRALRRIDFHGQVLGQTVALRLGLSESDIKALEVLVEAVPVTAGRLAEVLNLSTGAVTRLLDRLEQAGYVRRTPDAADRRRVIVEVVPDRLSAIRQVLEPLGDAHATVLADYSDEQLELINDFLTRLADAGRERAEAFREAPDAIGAEGAYRAPLGATSEARLVVRSGASDLSIDASAPSSDLFRARFAGSLPRVRVRGGTVVVAYRGGMREILDWRRRAARIALNPSIPWTVEIHGGMSRARADLAAIDVRSFGLSGGADRIRLELGAPTGIVPVRLSGGANDLRIERPADAAVLLFVSGGASRVELDEQRLGSASEVSLGSPADASQRTERFEVQVSGGTSRLAIVRRKA